eukprot:TRINITY_DN59602_c0_g1_i1.p1 TRINITY_DN59602_c0_g1~~TRINITY_DN59602_c0_g1_i1.p1  ORF type:complete len:938 (-),score=182.75 TRINITY_DN59602_c0_g1_i1:560-3373(-)
MSSRGQRYRPNVRNLGDAAARQRLPGGTQQTASRQQRQHLQLSEMKRNRSHSDSEEDEDRPFHAAVAARTNSPGSRVDQRPAGQVRLALPAEQVFFARQQQQASRLQQYQSAVSRGYPDEQHYPAESHDEEETQCAPSQHLAASHFWQSAEHQYQAHSPAREDAVADEGPTLSSGGHRFCMERRDDYTSEDDVLCHVTRHADVHLMEEPHTQGAAERADHVSCDDVDIPCEASIFGHASPQTIEGDIPCEASPFGPSTPQTDGRDHLQQSVPALPQGMFFEATERAASSQLEAPTESHPAAEQSCPGELHAKAAVGALLPARQEPELTSVPDAPAAHAGWQDHQQQQHSRKQHDMVDWPAGEQAAVQQHAAEHRETIPVILHRASQRAAGSEVAPLPQSGRSSISPQSGRQPPSSRSQLAAAGESDNPFSSNVRAGLVPGHSVMLPPWQPLGQDSAAALFWDWLRKKGAFVDNVVVKTGGVAGRGLFVTRAFRPGEVICSVPRSMALTTEQAAASAVGKHAAAAGASAELTLWLYMAEGLSDDMHLWHRYLNSLPRQQPDAAGWAEHFLRNAFRGTDLHARLELARRSLDEEMESVFPELPVELRLPRSSISWAKGMTLSRGFPTDLVEKRDSMLALVMRNKPAHDGAPEAVSSSTEAVGCLVPLLDLANHALSMLTTAHVEFDAESDTILLRAITGLPAGSEVLINYGTERSNEDLIYCYGFALPEHFDRAGGLIFTCQFDDEESTEEKQSALRALGVPCVTSPGQNTVFVGPFRVGGPPWQAALPPRLRDALDVLEVPKPTETVHWTQKLKERLEEQLPSPSIAFAFAQQACQRDSPAAAAACWLGCAERPPRRSGAQALRSQLEWRLELLQEKLDHDVATLGPTFAVLDKGALATFRNCEEAFEVSCAAYRQSQRKALESALEELKRDFLGWET